MVKLATKESKWEVAFWWEAAPFAACCLLLLLRLLPLAMHGEARMHAVAPVDTWCPQCLCTMSYVVTTATTDQTASEQLGLCTAVLFWSVGMECPERTCYPLGHYITPPLPKERMDV